MNPRAPLIYDLIKLLKQDRSLRPIVNWKESPGYKVGKHINTLLKRVLTLSHSFNVQNSHSLAQSLSNIETDANTKLCSFDIENMYMNIPNSELVNIIKNIMNCNYSTKMRKMN
jgi:hypothetical protein